jgi:hypothetical protein
MHGESLGLVSRLDIGGRLDRPGKTTHGLREVTTARARQGVRACLPQAAWMALPTLAMVIDPPCTGARGSRVSPRVNFTRSIGKPSVSAATCVIEVHVPGPMSLAALITSAVPSGKSRAIADAGA